MVCCSYSCPRYQECAISLYNNKNEEPQYAQDWFSFGSCAIQWKENKAVIDEHYACGPGGNWAMFKPIEKEEDKEMNDTLKICIEFTPYTKDITLDFEHPVRVRSVWNHDELVEIEHDGHKFIVSQSEMDKAIGRASHFGW